jgi:two-component system sensor histidine kinase TctE
MPAEAATPPRPVASPTLLRRLLFALLPALLLLAGIGAALDYRQVLAPADLAYDQALASTAIGLATLPEEPLDDIAAHRRSLTAALARRNPQGLTLYVVQSSDGRTLAGTSRLIAQAAPTDSTHNPAFHDDTLDGRPVRIVTYRTTQRDGGSLVVIAETLEARRAAANQALHAAMGTNLAIVIAVLLVVTFGVRLALRPLHALGRQVSLHDTDTLQPLRTDAVPLEVRPLVDGFNLLIERLRATTQAQQAFLNTSAHQLRTPLAGLQAQLDLLVDETEATRQAQRLDRIRAAVLRLTRLTHQMLALARTDARTQATPRLAPGNSSQPVDLVDLLQELAAQQLDAALARQVDLGIETAPVRVEGERWMLREMVGNLLDNALQHAPPHSAVTLRCGSGLSPDERAVIEVEDAGPGIPLAQRERVFERFVRLDETVGNGSGLGLAIVREVAEAHGARVSIREGSDGTGTRFRVTFLR